MCLRCGTGYTEHIITSLHCKKSSTQQVVDLESLRAELLGLEMEAAAGDLWDRQAEAQALLQKISDVKERIREAQELQEMLSDIEAAVELADLAVCGPLSFLRVATPASPNGVPSSIAFMTGDSRGAGCAAG